MTFYSVNAYSLFAGRPDKVETRMNASVLKSFTVRLHLLPIVVLLLFVDVLDDRCPAVLV